jgi:DNA replication ATP-dependent helicase Dna2
MTKEENLGKLFLREVEKIMEAGDSRKEKIEAFYYLLHKIFLDVTQEERIHFTTIFARIAFLAHKYDVSPTLESWTYRFRKAAAKGIFKDDKEEELYYWLGAKVLVEQIIKIFKVEITEDLAAKLPNDDFFPVQNTAMREKMPQISVVAVEDDADAEWLICKSEEQPEKLLRVKYNTQRNESFANTIKGLRNVMGFPVALNLIEVEVDSNGILYPRAIVVEPDYLVDVTSISECFKESNQTEPLQYLVNRFLPKTPSVNILLGNIANFFLDELIVNPEADFNVLFRQTFRIAPFHFAILEDKEVTEIRNLALTHFTHLKKVVVEAFETTDFNRKNCFIEPSFYAQAYGIQGRLDLLHLHPDNKKKNAIVELKSGKPFRPNRDGISHSHYTQTLLYDLMIKAAFGDDAEPENFILYSQLADNQLRYARIVRSQQYEALQLRNQLVGIDQSIINLNKAENALNPFEKLRVDNFPNGGFLRRDIEVFEKIYQPLDDTEKAYFHAFASMIAREHQLAKTGLQGVENANGVASLWLNPLSEKEENFEVFSFLKIRKNASGEKDAYIIFEKTDKTNPLANFRIGDIATLYPAITVENDGDVLKNQVFKGTLTEITADTITFRLRSPQSNQTIFHQYIHWNIEHDLLDSSFLGMYRGLTTFFSHPKEKRNLLLTRTAPRIPTQQQPFKVANQRIALTDEQHRILEKIVVAKDYFLLWGPPGTGKTSVMLSQLTAHLIENTTENILLLAYTNRAVDEICEAIEANGEAYSAHYLRIGSRHSTDISFHKNLLDKQLEEINTRKDLRELIESRRIFVATVSSMNGRLELLKLKKFHSVIIDEASQITEPQIVGLLPNFERFVLIGDHRQLPAIVTQNENETAVKNEDLHQIGLENLRNSFFERLYQRCKANHWDYAYDQLSHQGRMHEELVAFPSKYFYNENLFILPEKTNSAQQKSLTFKVENNDAMQAKLATRRKLFFHTERDTSSKNPKINIHEANLVGEIIEKLTDIYDQNFTNLHKGSIGVITPYRAQIAQIQQVITDKKLPLSAITVDTVERYQGGARDIIIISLCSNTPSQARGLVSLSSDGVDRKLNVALTRARQQIIVIGNANLLKEVGMYGKLIEWLED